MLLFRAVLLLLLIAGLVCFALYMATGQVKWRKMGLLIIKWAVIAGLAFFAVLFLERMVLIL